MQLHTLPVECEILLCIFNRQDDKLRLVQDHKPQERVTTHETMQRCDCAAILAKNSVYLYKHQAKPLKQCIKKLFVLDFEATCEKNEIVSPQEIIEFPCLVLNSTSYNIEAKFHKYVKPKFNPISPFCTELTGIAPGTVENESEFPEVFEQFTKWLEMQLQTGTPEEMIFVTCGNWDLKSMLPRQCALYNLTIPEAMRRWINLKVAFYQNTGYFPRGLVDMHKHLNLILSGRLHSGIG
ncbi:hypothetical protein V9T40_014366 [Parthenolecanium corni]|uniref:Exonuclease domain-containing protein n=1 Tax=Parthenolecanium corni TaxID=536013 RepID=A0AAN9T704_9HEMI